jgi:hypothetical protein
LSLLTSGLIDAPPAQRHLTRNFEPGMAQGFHKLFQAGFDSSPCGSRIPALNIKWEQVDDL